VSEALRTVRATLAGERAWVVGGAVRDRLLGRHTEDIDLVLFGDLPDAARRVARAAGGTAFALSKEFGAWRVIGPRRAWQVDLSAPRAPTIEGDLAQRDFTVNAIAEPLAGGAPIDPLGGAADLAARRLRMVGPGAFADDPLRTLRLVRIATELGLEPDGDTEAAARRHAAAIQAVAPERVFAELKRLICADAVLDGLALLQRIELTPLVLPELARLRGVEQSDYHHLDVYDHTLAVLAETVALVRDPQPALGAHAGAVAELLAEPLADELTRAQALRFGALLHDAAKPQTRAVSAEGRVSFHDHDAQGAELARAALTRLRTSERLRAHVAALTRHHLRLGFLVHRRPLDRRTVYRYLTTCEPVEVDVSVLSVADRLATRGRNADVAIAKHLELARELVGEALARRDAGPQPPLIRGDELAARLGTVPGPELGRVLAELEEARFAGEIRTGDDAVALARRLLGQAAG